MASETNPENVFSLGFKLGSASRLLGEAKRTAEAQSHYGTFMKLHEAKQDLIQAHSLLLRLRFRSDADMVKNVTNNLDSLMQIPLLGSPKSWTPRCPEPGQRIASLKVIVDNVFCFVNKEFEMRSWEKAI